MTLSENINRIITAKQNMKTAFASIGVDIPSEEHIDEYYKYISQLTKPIPVSPNEIKYYLEVPKGYTQVGVSSHMLENITANHYDVYDVIYDDKIYSTSADTVTDVDIDNKSFHYIKFAANSTKIFDYLKFSTALRLIVQKSSGSRTTSRYPIDFTKKIEFGNGFTTIENNAFSSKSGLTEVILPETVEIIGNEAFRDCSGLTSITIPPLVTTIGDCAFQRCSKLESISVPEGVTSIQESTFAGCSSLKNINLPSTITKIGRYAFVNCSSLENIYFNGTKEQFKNITKGVFWRDFLLADKIHCIDGDYSLLNS